MKRWVPWTVAALAIALVAGGALRAVKARKAQAVQASQPVAEAVVTLLVAHRPEALATYSDRLYLAE